MNIILLLNILSSIREYIFEYIIVRFYKQLNIILTFLQLWASLFYYFYYYFFGYDLFYYFTNLYWMLGVRKSTRNQSKVNYEHHKKGMLCLAAKLPVCRIRAQGRHKCSKLISACNSNFSSTRSRTEAYFVSFCCHLRSFRLPLLAITLSFYHVSRVVLLAYFMQWQWLWPRHCW